MSGLSQNGIVVMCANQAVSYPEAEIGFEKVDYQDLNAKQREVYTLKLC